MTNDFDKSLPFNLEAEQSVLGALLIDASYIPIVLSHLKPDSFFRPQHQKIFSIILQKFVASETIDFITVLETVIRQRIFDSEQDAKVYISVLVQIVPTASNIESYAKIVKEKYYLRRLVSTFEQVVAASRDATVDASSLMDMAEQSIYDIREGKDSSGLVRIDEVILSTYDRLQRMGGEERDNYIGLQTGFTSLDMLTTGLNKSDLLFVAARPGMGKTSFAMNVATHVAKNMHTTAVFSLEMSKEQLVTRMLSSEAFIDMERFKTGMLSPDDWTRLAVTTQILSKTPIYIDDTPGITVSEIKAKLRRLKGVSLVIIDYLQLMGSGMKRSYENRVQEVSEITRSLKIMAKEFNIPIVVLSQLSRGPDSRSDKRPLLSDLRESGSIEQDADLVMFLYRDAYYNKDTEEQNISECIVAKNRHGGTDTIKLGWDGQHTRFINMEFSRHE